MNILDHNTKHKKSSGEFARITRENLRLNQNSFHRKNNSTNQNLKNLELFVNNDEPSPGLKQKYFLLFVEELEMNLGFKLPKDNFQNLSSSLKEKLSLSIDCSVNELFIFWKKIEKILEKADVIDCKIWELSLGERDFKLNLSSTEIFPNRLLVSKQFERESLYSKNIQNSYIKIPESQILKCQEIEKELQNAFSTCSDTNFSEKNLQLTQNSLFLIKEDIENTRKKNFEINNLKKEIYWHKEELNFLISQKKYKKKEYLKKEHFLQDQLSKIRTQRLTVAEDFEKIEKEAKKIESKKEKIQSILLEINNFLTSINHKQPLKTESQQVSNLQISDFETQLKDLESKFKVCPETEKESLNIQMNRLKTKISGLKSVNAITSASQFASTARSVIKNLNKVYTVNDFICKTPNTIKVEPASLSIPLELIKKESSEYLSALKTDRNLADECFEKKNGDYSKSEFLKKKEIRLIEKEEILEYTENNIISKLGLTDQVNDIKILKVENKRIRNRLERQQKSVEIEYAELEKYRGDVCERRKEVETKVEEMKIEKKLLCDEKLRIDELLKRFNDYLNGVLSDF